MGQVSFSLGAFSRKEHIEAAIQAMSYSPEMTNWNARIKHRKWEVGRWGRIVRTICRI